MNNVKNMYAYEQGSGDQYVKMISYNRIVAFPLSMSSLICILSDLPGLSRSQLFISFSLTKLMTSILKDKCINLCYQ